ncbi:MAG: N-acetylmuramoyl-L-alanine amidase-like domain-containing protein [Bacteroidaceae bacterium]
MLHYARQFIGVPYVAHTLENKDGRERLVINLQQMDCTTLVETVVALTLATQHGGTRWRDFCYWLTTIRYINGYMDGYASRCHYFSQWIASAQEMGLVSEMTGDGKNGYFPFTDTQNLCLHYMSRHRDAYPVIAHDDREARRVECYERQYSGACVRYIPASLIGHGRTELSCIRDGDILALVTRKDGLDVSHLGLAVWGGDGRLHLLNASSIYHRVVLDEVPLCDYLKRHPSSLGVRVIRVNR